MGSRVPGVEGQGDVYELGKSFVTGVEGWSSRKYKEAQAYASDVGDKARVYKDQAQGHVVIGNHVCESAPTGVNIGLFRSSALKMARNIGVSAVRGEETYQSVKGIWDDNGVTFDNAQLAADMLVMYLNQTYDQHVVDRIRDAVRKSHSFEKLGEFVSEHVEKKANGKPLNEMQLKIHVQAALDLARKSIKEGGMGFYFSGEGLQPVIGGVTGLKALSCRMQPAAKGSNETKYVCDIMVEDTYDFDNNRKVKDEKTGQMRETAYSIFREHLTDLILQGKYCEFEQEYNKAVDTSPFTGGGWDDMNKGHVFASFMYALEKAGLFHGIRWSITATMESSFTSGSASPSGSGTGSRF